MMTDIIIEITIGFLLYVVSLKSSQIQFERVRFSKIFWEGMPPDPPSISMLCMHVCFAHSSCIVSKSQGHVNYLGPGIKIGLVTPLVVMCKEIHVFLF